MKKTNKWFGLKITLGAIATLTPLAALTACSTENNVSSATKQQLTLAQNIFNIKDGVLYGFAKGTTADQIQQYVKNGKFVIPGSSLGVYKVASRAFANTNLQANIVEIGKGIVVLEDYVFYGDKEIKEVRYEDGIEQSVLQLISKGAFAGCESLTSISFPKTLVTAPSTIIPNKGIEDQAFLGCKALAKVDLSNMTLDQALELNLGKSIFDSGKDEGTIVLNKDIEKTDENEILTGLVRTNLFASGLEIKKPTIDQIKSNTYSWTISLRDTAGDTVWTGHKYFPAHRKFLKYDSTGKILQGLNGRYAMATNICNTIYLDSNTKSFAVDEEQDPLFTYLNEHSPKKQFTNFKYLWIADDGITAIPNGLCSNNSDAGGFTTKLVQVRLPKTTNLTIGEYAFNSCDSLTTININEATKLTKIQANAFGYDEALTNFAISGTLDTGLFAPSNTLTTIGDNAFYKCTGINTIKLWNFGTATPTFGTDIFAKCTGTETTKGIKCIDMSRLTYNWNPTNDAATGTLVSTWMSKQTYNIFGKLDSETLDTGKTHKVVMPVYVPAEGTSIATPIEDFKGLTSTESKEHWHNHAKSGFFWTVYGSDQYPLYNWDYINLDTSYTLTGGERQITIKVGETHTDTNPWANGKHKANNIHMLSPEAQPEGLTLTAEGKVNCDASIPADKYVFRTEEVVNGKVVATSPSITLDVESYEITPGTDSLDIDYTFSSGEGVNWTGKKGETAWSCTRSGAIFSVGECTSTPAFPDEFKSSLSFEAGKLSVLGYFDIQGHTSDPFSGGGTYTFKVMIAFSKTETPVDTGKTVTIKFIKQ